MGRQETLEGPRSSPPGKPRASGRCPPALRVPGESREDSLGTPRRGASGCIFDRDRPLGRPISQLSRHRTRPDPTQHPILCTLAALALTSAPALAQSTHFAGTAAEVSALLAGGAADGDLILLEPGDYDFFNPWGFAIDRPLRIAARIPGTVDVRTTDGAMVENLPADRLASIAGMRFRHFTYPFNGSGPGLRVQNCDGLVVLEDCELIGAGIDFGTSPPVIEAGLELGDARLMASGCTFSGAYGVVNQTSYLPGPGIAAANSELFLDACTLLAFDGASAELGPPIDPQAGGPALRVSGGRTLAARTFFRSGDGGDGLEVVAPFCIGPAAGGNAIVCEGASSPALELFDCIVTPGAGGASPTACGGGQAPDGEPFTGPSFDPALLRNSAMALGLDAPAVLPGGTQAFVQIHDLEPGSAKWLLIGRDAVALQLPGLDGFPILNGPLPGFVFLGSNDTLLAQVPTLPIGAHVGLLLQALELTTAGLPVVHPARFTAIY